MRVLSHTSAKRMARCSLVSLMPKSYVITCGASVRKLLAALLFLSAGAAAAQWPARPVKLVVPSSAGGGTDFYARLLAHALAEALGQHFVVENLPGGSGNVGAAAAARAAPDGYTFLVAADPALTVNQSLFKNLPYDPERDFVPVARGVTVPLVICVQPSLGMGMALPALLAGQIDFLLPDVAIVVPHLKSGRLVALALTHRTAQLPEVPAIADAGFPDFYMPSNFSVMAPAGTPRPLIERMNAEINKAMRGALAEKLESHAFIPQFLSPDEFAAALARDRQYWAAFIRRAGITPD